MDRSKVYERIDGERAYQQAQGKPDERSVEDWIYSVRYYALEAWLASEHKGSKESILTSFRKLAAVTVAALEQYGCPPREGYEAATGADAMSKPQRIQRRRTKGWKMPEGAVYVGRPSKWGNPYSIDSASKLDPYSRVSAVEFYRVHLERNPQLVDDAKRELRGKVLCCWCREDEPCHADVLLALCAELDEKDNSNASETTA